MPRRIVAVSTGLVIAAAALACEGRATGVITDGTVGTARVRLLNALTSASAVDFIVDGSTASAAVPFGSGSGYASLTTATHRLQARASASGTTLLDFTRDLTTAGSYSLVMAPGLGESGALFIADDRTTVPGKAKVRVLHAAAAPGPVSVYMTGATTDLATVTPAISTLPFTGASQYLLMDPGTYRIRLTTAGTTAVLADLPGVTVGAGTVRTLLVTDAPGGGTPPSLWLIPDAP